MFLIWAPMDFIRASIFFSYSRASSFSLAKEADDIVNAVDKVLSDGYRTADIAHGKEALSTVEMTDRIIECL